MLDSLLRTRQLSRIEPELFARALYHARIENLVRAAQRNLRLSTLPMHCHNGLAFVPPMVFTVINAATLLHQPFSECGTFHFSAIGLESEDRKGDNRSLATDSVFGQAIGTAT